MEADSALDQAERILEASHEAGIVLRLFGGLGIHLHCPSRQDAGSARDYQDLDFVGYRQQSRKVRLLLEDLGYEPDKRFNALHGAERVIFFIPEQPAHVDVVFDRLRMCHTIELAHRLELDEQTLSPSDLFLTKAQIVELNPKDVHDLLDLMQDHELAEGEDDVIDLAYILSLTVDRWGLHHTLERNIEALAGLGREESPRYDRATERLEAMLAAMSEAPKTRRWKLRARIGERLPWYELPEEARR